MRLLSIDSVKEGMRIAKNIYTFDGNILLAEGVSLSGSIINRLKELGLSTLYIIDDKIGRIEVEGLVKEQTRVEAIKITKEVMNNIHNNRMPDGQKVAKVVKDVTEELVQNPNVMVNLIEIRAMNDFTFAHNISVCILSLITGIALGLSYYNLKQLGSGAIMHDVGKALIPDVLLNKPAKLSPAEFTEVQKHAQLGYDVLKKNSDFSATAAFVAWQHHERFDGSGYPKGISGEKIHQFARIVALADVYDALTTDRPYRKQLMPHEAIEYIRDQSGKLFDPEITKVFLQNIAPFPVGSIVLLNTGEQAVITKVTKSFPARPLIRIIIDREGNPLTEPIEKDLKKDLTLFIVKNI